MDREIKFRLWDTEKKRWEPLMEIMTAFGLSTVIPHVKTFKLLEPGFVLCQYTGLKDKNGVEIYEGDLVEYPAAPIFQVVWRIWSCSFVLKEPGESHFPLDGNPSYNTVGGEVIGNIYENPELIKENPDAST